MLVYVQHYNYMELLYSLLVRTCIYTCVCVYVRAYVCCAFVAAGVYGFSFTLSFLFCVAGTNTQISSSYFEARSCACIV